MSAGRKVMSKPHALFSYTTPKKTQMSESESMEDCVKSVPQKKSDLETPVERKTGTPIRRQQTVNNTPPFLKINNLRRSRSAQTLERTPTKQANLPPHPISEVKTVVQSKIKMSPRGGKVETNPREQITRRLMGSPSIRIQQQSPRKMNEVDRTPQSPKLLRTPQSPRIIKTPRDTRNIPSSLPKPNASEKKTIKRDFPSNGNVHIKTSVRTIRTLKGDSEPDSNFVTPNNSTPLSHNVKYIRAQFEKNNVKPPPSPSPSKNRVRFNENVKMYPEQPSSSLQMTPSGKFSADNNVNTESKELKGILTPGCKTNDQDHISNGHEPSASSLLRKSCLRRSLSDHCLDSMRKKNSECTPPPFRLQTGTKNRVVLDSVTPDCFSPVLLDTCQKSQSCENLTVEVEDGETANLTVGVRVRPPNPGEYEAVHVVENSVQVETDQNTLQCVNYDYCFTSVGPQAASQEYVYNTMVKPLVNTAFEGYNVCMFAYGQTGSGKSYSMMGLIDGVGDNLPESAGIIPRFCNDLLIEANKEMYCRTSVYISYFEIYNEKIHDLLAPSNADRKAPLRVREHPKLGPYVVGLTAHKVDSFSGVQDCMYFGDMRRMSAATGMNENSSRSHSIFSITLSQAQTVDEFVDFSSGVRSKVNLVDLAGSERVAQTCASGDRLREGVSINRSLLTLGKVINCLAENRRGFIPYRESLLTWLLKESLGGNSRTVMLATISPGSAHVEESLATLRYACQARSIINTIHINETAQQRSIREMSEELQRLRQQGIHKEEDDALMGELNKAEDKIDVLKNELDKVMDELKEVHRLNSTLQNERDFLMQQNSELNENITFMKNEILSLENTNELIMKEKNNIEKEKVNLDERNTCLLNENAMLVKEKLTLVKEKIRLEQLNSSLEKMIDTLEEDKIKVEKDKARLTKEKRSLEKLKSVLEKQNINLMEEKGEIEKQIAEKENLNLVDKTHLEKEQLGLHEKIRKLEEELLFCKKEHLSLKKSLKTEQKKPEQEITRTNSDIENQVQSLCTDFSHTKEQVINYINRKHQANDDEKEELRKVNEELKEQLDQQCQTNSFLKKQIEQRVNRIQEGYENIPDPEQMNEAFIEAADICTRLQLPFVFRSEPEVTTATWFPVNVRVYDLHQGTSVRWTQYAFLSWLKSMKDSITSNSRGRILFKDAQWLQNNAAGSTCSSPCVGMSPSTGFSAKKEQPLRNEISNVRMQIAALENLRGCNDKRELQTVVTNLEEVLQRVSTTLGVKGQFKCALKFSSPTKDKSNT